MVKRRLRGAEGGSARPILMAVGLVLLLVVTAFMALLRSVPRTSEPEAFDLLIDIPVADVGYGMVRLTTGPDFSYAEASILDSSGLALIDNRNEFEACEPCMWDIYVVDPLAETVSVSVELTGWLLNDTVDPGASWATPSPLPSAQVETIDVAFAPLQEPTLVRIEYDTVYPPLNDHGAEDGQSGVLWRGPDLSLVATRPECPPACYGDSYRQVSYALVEQETTGTLTVLNTGEQAPAPDLVLTPAVGLVADSRSVEDWGSSRVLIAAQAAERSSQPAAVIVEVFGVTRGSEREQLSLFAGPLKTHLTGRHSIAVEGQVPYAIGLCDSAGRCDVTREFRLPILPLDLTATFHWAYFEEPVPTQPPAMEFDFAQ